MAKNHFSVWKELKACKIEKIALKVMKENVVHENFTILILIIFQKCVRCKVKRAMSAMVYVQNVHFVGENYACLKSLYKYVLFEHKSRHLEQNSEQGILSRPSNLNRL